MEWKVGDWCIFNLNIVQIKKLDGYSAEVSDGSFNTYGRLVDRFRPLTLRNKRIIEWFDYHYNELQKINGEAGFNYPRISDYFEHLSREAIDNGKDHTKSYDLITEFVHQAREYTPVIQ